MKVEKVYMNSDGKGTYKKKPPCQDSPICLPPTSHLAGMVINSNQKGNNMNIEFATCERHRALKYLQNVLPNKNITDTPESAGKFLDLVEKDIVRVQDPMIYGKRIGIVPSNNYDEKFKEEIMQECQKLMHNDNEDTIRKDKAKQFCNEKGLIFLEMSKDGKRFKAIDPSVNSENYEFTLFDYSHSCGGDGDKSERN